MIAPYRHVRDLAKLSREELADMMDLLVETKRLLDRTLKPKGYNIGMNLGKIAGAGFEGHVHLHVVPRWTGDTNFMPTVGGSKVISDSLDAVYALLKGATGEV
jgi:ATP adenylyltransferase